MSTRLVTSPRIEIKSSTQMAETFRREKRLGLSEDEELFGYIHIAFPDLSGLSYGIMKELYRTSSAGGFFTHHGVVLCSLYNPNPVPVGTQSPSGPEL